MFWFEAKFLRFCFRACEAVMQWCDIVLGYMVSVTGLVLLPVFNQAYAVPRKLAFRTLEAYFMLCKHM